MDNPKEPISDETREKLSVAGTGRIPWNKGLHHSDETRHKMSIAHKGKTTWNKGLPSPRKGIPLTDETKRKMSLARKGKEPWNKGTKGLMKNLPSTAYKKGCAHRIGMKHSEETKNKLRKPRPSMRGENHPNWKGGTSKPYKHQTNRYEYKFWRDSVFKRDNYTCQNCGRNHLYITAHHIKGWTQFPELRYEISNGITLCKECHSKTDNYMMAGKKKTQ